MSIIRPRKLPRPKMGVREQERRTYPVHQAYVRRHSCSVPGCAQTPIEFDHVQTRGAGGHDGQGVAVCVQHHVERHAIGIETFQLKYGIDLYAIASYFAKNTTDRALREAMREARLLDPVPAWVPS